MKAIVVRYLCFFAMLVGAASWQCVCAQQVVPQTLGNSQESVPAIIDRLSIKTASKTVSLTFPLRTNHTLNVTGEYVSVSSIPKLYEKSLGLRPTWKFRAIPVTVSYSYSLPTFSERFIPVAGAGLAAFFYRKTLREEVLIPEAVGFQLPASNPSLSLQDAQIQRIAIPRATPSTPEVRFESAHHVGISYGAELFLGVRSLMTDNVYIQALWRYRYLRNFADGNKSGAIAFVENRPYSDFNLSLGFGFIF